MLVSGDLCVAQLSYCATLAQLFANFQIIAFFKKGCKKSFPNFSVLSLTLHKSLFLRLLKHYKIGVSAFFVSCC